MTRSLPIIGDVIDELTNAFPPRRMPVPDRRIEEQSGIAQLMGFFTDTTLCIGCKACEVACKQWNQLPADGFDFTGYSYDNTRHLGSTTWRHVSFKEQIGERGARWLMMSDVCKHCDHAPCEVSCPTGAILYNEFGDVYVQADICNGCGYCISACPFGVLGRNEDDGHAHKCTLCYDRQKDDMTPACAKACPTASIQFGPVQELRDRAKERVRQLHARGNTEAYLYGADSVGDYGPLNSFFLLEDHPNHYNLPEEPPQPFRGQAKRYALGLLTGLAMAAVSSIAFSAARRGD